MSEEEKDIYNNIHAEDDLLTSGYTTIASNQGDFKPIRKPPREGVLRIPMNDNRTEQTKEKASAKK